MSNKGVPCHPTYATGECILDAHGVERQLYSLNARLAPVQGILQNKEATLKQEIWGSSYDISLYWNIGKEKYHVKFILIYTCKI